MIGLKILNLPNKFTSTNMPKNKPSVLLICNTPFQIMMACHIATLYYKDYDVDITISEGIKGGETLAQNAQNVPLFRRVFFIKNKKTFYFILNSNPNLQRLLQTYILQSLLEKLKQIRFHYLLYKTHHNHN